MSVEPFLNLNAPVKIKSIQQAYLHRHMLRHHKGGAPIIEIQESLKARRCPHLQLQTITRIHDYVWRLWEMGYVSSRSQYDDRYNPGLTYWTPIPESQRRQNAKPKKIAKLPQQNRTKRIANGTKNRARRDDGKERLESGDREASRI